MLGICNAMGDIDSAAASAFGGDLHDAIDESLEECVIVDCAGVTFMDSSGYHALVTASEYATRRDRTLVIRNLSPSCARLLRICDQDHTLRLEA